MEIDRSSVTRQLERIVTSERFAASRQLQAFLRYLVAAALDGTAEGIKGYSVAVDVFGRSEDFDPSEDPIVRVQAGRLRRLLQSYYDTAGVEDDILITVPKGGYKAEFALLGAGAPKNRPEGGPDGPEEQGIAVAVLPFVPPTPTPEFLELADGLTDDVSSGLARSPAMRLASRSSSYRYRERIASELAGQQLGVRYLVDGSLRRSGEGLRVTVQLVDAAADASIWTATFAMAGSETGIVRDELGRQIVSELRHRLLTTAKHDSARKTAGKETVWDLFLRSTWVPDEGNISLAEEQENVARARRALDMDPLSGKAHSVLADKLSYLANLDPGMDTPENASAAIDHAQQALMLEPRNADVLFNVSMHGWHAGRHRLCLSAARRVLELDPNHYLEAFLVKAIPYIDTTVPPALIAELMAQDAKLASDNIGRWVILSWIGMLHLNNDAMDEAAEFGWRAHDIYSGRSPETTLWLCAALVGIGEADAAADLVDEALQHWPTLNLRHYADRVVVRRYGTSAIAPRMHQVFSRLADAVEASRTGQSRARLPVAG